MMVGKTIDAFFFSSIYETNCFKIITKAMDALIFCIPLNEKRSKAKENFLFKGCNKNTKGSINDI